MANNTNNRKTTKIFNLPKAKVTIEQKRTLPFNGKAVTEESLSFSFACFDRSHKLFNLGDNNGAVTGEWFVEMLDCFKSVSNMKFAEIKGSIHRMHPIDWNKTNTAAPVGSEQHEYWQFRINKSKGRVIGFRIGGVFYVVWLDPHHNLTNSKGYGVVNYYRPALSLYEKKEQELAECKRKCKHLQEELEAAEELLNSR